MYNLPEMRNANAAFWQAMQTELAVLGVAAPASLESDRTPVPDAIEPDTLFTQVCGWPLQTIYRGQAVILGVPIYDAPFCDGPSHAGVFVTHRDAPFHSIADLRGCRFVFNSLNSNTGMNLPRRTIAEIADSDPFFGRIAETHSHPGNLERVARGEADATCVDCVTYTFFARFRPELATTLRVIAATHQSPAIPFVTSVTTPVAMRAALRAALFRVAEFPGYRAAREGLMLRGVVDPATVDYSIQLGYTDQAVALGYPVLR